MKFSDLVASFIDATTNPCGTVDLDTLADVFAAVTPRGERPRALRQALNHLGYRVERDQVRGLSLRTIAYYTRPAPGEALDVEDLLSSARPGFERRYVNFLVSTVAEDGLLHNLSL